MSIEGRGIQSIEVGGRLLDVLAKESGSLMLRDLAQKAGLPAAQAHTYLVSYRKLNLVEQDPENGKYRIGPYALQLGLARLKNSDPSRIVADAARALSAEIGLMVVVVVWGTHGPTVTQVEEGIDQIYVNIRMGTVFSLSGTASGRLFATYLPHRQLKSMLTEELEANWDHRKIGKPTTAAVLEAARHDVRALGFAGALGSPIPHVNAVSAPIFDHTGTIRFGLTVIAKEAVLKVSNSTPEVKSLTAICRAISAQLGYQNHEELITPAI